MRWCLTLTSPPSASPSSGVPWLCNQLNNSTFDAHSEQGQALSPDRLAPTIAGSRGSSPSTSRLVVESWHPSPSAWRSLSWRWWGPAWGTGSSLGGAGWRCCSSGSQAYSRHIHLWRVIEDIDVQYFSNLLDEDKAIYSNHTSIWLQFNRQLRVILSLKLFRTGLLGHKFTAAK